MIRIISFFFALLFSSLSLASGVLAWPADVLVELQKESVKGPSTVRLLNSSSMMIFQKKDGTSVRLDRTDVASQFFVNSKMLDISELTNPAELRRAIQKKLYHVSSITFSLMAVAAAEDNATLDSTNVGFDRAMTEFVARILEGTRNADKLGARKQKCAAFFAFGKQCNDFANQIRSLLNQRSAAAPKASSEDSQARILAIFDKLDSLVGRLKRDVIPFWTDPQNVKTETTCHCSDDPQKPASQTCEDDEQASNPALADLVLCQKNLEMIQQLESMYRDHVAIIQQAMAQAQAALNAAGGGVPPVVTPVKPGAN